MKKFIGLVFALLFATSAIAQEDSEKLKQEVLSGSLEQTVIVGESIEQIIIKYTNLKSHKSQFIEALGLTESWVENVCYISGKIDRNLEAPAKVTTKIILEGTAPNDSAFTGITFNLLPRETALKVVSGSLNQSVKAGEAISPIILEYDNITKIERTAFPNGISFERNSETHEITIKGTVDNSVETGDYGYKILGITEQDDTLEVSGTFSVQGLPRTTTIEIVENGTQKLTAGDSIKPIVLKYANMTEPVLAPTLPGEYEISNDKTNHTLTVFGRVNENTKDGNYAIKITAKGESNNATVTATFEITHKPAVTKIELIGDGSPLTANAGDSIKPVVFKFENATSFHQEGFPGSSSLEINKDEKTATLIGLLNKNAKGDYTITVEATGIDNNATASVTIKVNPLPLEFKIIEGSDKQTVVAGESIVPIVYHYERLSSIKVGGFPDNVQYDLIQDEHLFKIFGTVASDAEIKEYTYTIELLDLESIKTTVTGTINVVAPQQSSSSAETSSSSVTSSSAKSSSSIKNEESSSSIKSSSSNSEAGSSNSSKSSSSIKQSSNSAKSSTSVKSSSSKGKSSSSAKSSSSGKSSNEKSSDSKTDLNTFAAVQNVKFSFANNKLTVTQPTSSMIRVQVFDLTGHLVESFIEHVSGVKSFSLAHLNKGNYVIRIIDGSREIRTAKIIVK